MENKIHRDLAIWTLSRADEYMTQKEIASFVGCSQSTVGETIRKLSSIGSLEDQKEYFAIGFDLHDILRETSSLKEANYSTICLLNAINRAGIKRRSQIKNMTVKEMNDFIQGKELKAAGKRSKDAFCEYRYRLKHRKQYYAE